MLDMHLLLWTLLILLEAPSDWRTEVTTINLTEAITYSENYRYSMQVNSGRNFVIKGPGANWSFQDPLPFLPQIQLSDDGRCAVIGNEAVSTGDMGLKVFYEQGEPWAVSASDLKLYLRNELRGPGSRRQFEQQEKGTRALICFVPETRILGMWSSVSNVWIGVDCGARQVRALSLGETTKVRAAAIRKAFDSLVLNAMRADSIYSPARRPTLDRYRLFTPTAALFLANTQTADDLPNLNALMLVSPGVLVGPDKGPTVSFLNDSRKAFLRIMACIRRGNNPQTRFDLEDDKNVLTDLSCHVSTASLRSRGTDLQFELLLDRESEPGDPGPIRFTFTSGRNTDISNLFRGMYFQIKVDAIPFGFYRTTILVSGNETPDVYKSDFTVRLDMNSTTDVGIKQFTVAR